MTENSSIQTDSGKKAGKIVFAVLPFIAWPLIFYIAIRLYGEDILEGILDLCVFLHIPDWIAIPLVPVFFLILLPLVTVFVSRKTLFSVLEQKIAVGIFSVIALLITTSVATWAFLESEEKNIEQISATSEVSKPIEAMEFHDNKERPPISPPEEQSVKEEVVSVSTGPIVVINNKCNHPIKLAVGYMDTNGEDVYATYDFEKLELAKLSHLGNLVRARGGKFYIYAKSKDGSGKEWRGDKAVTLDRNLTYFDKKDFDMVTIVVPDQTQEEYSHNLTCPD